MILWRLSKENSSMWYIPYFFWAFYHGQSVNLATNRKTLIILLQTLVFCLIFLGSVFQGVVTSVMIEQPKQPKFASFEELIESGQKIYVGSHLNILMRDDSRYQQGILSGQIIVGIDDSKTYDQLYEENAALATTCEGAKMIGNLIKNKFYVINKEYFPSFIELDASYANPFLKQWQNLLDRSFEAGLVNVWSQLWRNYFKTKKNIKEEPLTILTLKDLSLLFIILFISYILGGLILLCEIFHHDFFVPYLLRRRLNGEITPHGSKLSRTLFNVKRRKVLKVNRVIIVKPAKNSPSSSD